MDSKPVLVGGRLNMDNRSSSWLSCDKSNNEEKNANDKQNWRHYAETTGYGWGYETDEIPTY